MEYKRISVAVAVLFFCFPALSFGLNVGDKAPGFRGQSTQGEVDLINYVGQKNVILALYFAAFTPV
jgi:hypothetical protein